MPYSLRTKAARGAVCIDCERLWWPAFGEEKSAGPATTVVTEQSLAPPRPTIHSSLQTNAEIG